MATENETSDSSTDQSETDGQQNQNGADNTGSGETPPAEQSQSQQESSQEESNASQEQAQKDPQKASLLADLHKERKDRQTAQGKVTELETKVSELTTKAETVDAIQGKFDRLEAFLQAIPGPLGKALDSMSFTKALFESDKDINEILADWNKANPTATSAALGAGAANPASKGPTMNEILRAANSGSK